MTWEEKLKKNTFLGSVFFFYLHKALPPFAVNWLNLQSQ